MTDQTLAFLQRYDHFLITSHIGPDGDSIGSQIALHHFLSKLGKQTTLLNSDPPSYNMTWLPGCEAIEEFQGSVEQRKAIAAAEAIVVADTNALERLGDLADPVEKSQAPKLLIDHHTDPENWFDVVYQRPSASSTGELLYELITAHDASLIDEDLATVLYTAIMTDTGSFRYSNVTPAVHHIVADLLERGDLNPAPIHTNIFDTRSLEGVRLLSQVLDTMTLRYDGKIGYLVVTDDMLTRTGATWDDTEGLVNYVLSVESVKAGVLFKQTKAGVKLSFRSKGEVAVNRWAQAFDGGGHRNASGAYVQRPLEETIERVMAAAPHHVNLNFPDGADQLSDQDASRLAEMMRSRG